jgi:hypothetical protein
MPGICCPAGGVGLDHHVCRLPPRKDQVQNVKNIKRRELVLEVLLLALPSMCRSWYIMHVVEARIKLLHEEEGN